MSTFAVLLIALLMLAVGIALGAFLWRKFGPQSQHSRELEEKLKEAEQRLSQYQSEVAEHFLETSRRINELTRNYKEVHEYLASSAMRLTTPSLGKEIKVAGEISWPDESAATQDEQELVQDSSNGEEQSAEPEPVRKDQH